MRKINMHKKIMALVLAMAVTFTMAPVSAETTEVQISDLVYVNGYQLSAVAEGHRVVYTIEPEIDGLEVVEKGLVYGIVGYTNEDDMYCGSEGDYVLTSPAVVGRTDIKYGQTETAQSYLMTMQFSAFNVAEYTTPFYVRVYVKLSDGTYRYGELESYSVYDIAQKIYKAGMMPDKESHNYVYDKILSVVYSETETVDYDWTAEVVKPGDYN